MTDVITDKDMRKFLPIGERVNCDRCGVFIGTVGRKKPIKAWMPKDASGIYCSQACCVYSVAMGNVNEQMQAALRVETQEDKP